MWGTASLTAIGEARAATELARLLADPVYRGRGVPRGDGRAVLVLPGLFGSDLYLQPLRQWLQRLGYRPLRSGLAVNAGCPERLSRRVEGSLDRQLRAADGRLAIVGHSRGVILGWALAARLGERASHLILLGSPAAALVRAVREPGSAPDPTTAASPAVVEAGTLARRLLDPDCAFPACGCPFIGALARPLSAETSVLSLIARDDRIVSPDACRVADARNVAVDGTHSGLAYNAAAYREIAGALAGRG